MIDNQMSLLTDEHEEAPDAANVGALDVKICIIDASQGSVIAKVKKLQDGKIITESAGNLQNGTAHNKTLDSMQSFARLLDTANPNTVITASTLALEDTHDLVTVDKWKESGCPSNLVTRSRNHLDQRAGTGGILTIDCDDKTISKEQLLERIKEVIPDLDKLARVYTTSASSHLVNTDTGDDLTGVKGQRLYLAIKDQSDINRSINVLIERLWLAGHGYIEVSKAGRSLKRTIADKALGNVGHLDYIGGSSCIPPLTQRRAPAQWFEGDALDTHSVLIDLDKKERKELEGMITTEIALNQPKINEVKASYSTSKAIVNLAKQGIKNPTDDELETAKANVLRALDSSVLTGDFVLTMKNGDTLTVAHILSNRDLYDGAETRDPIEPDYNNSATVGKLYLSKTQATLHSFAHGGQVYKLFKQSRRIQHVHGSTAATTDQTIELMGKLGSYYNMGSNLVTIRGGAIINFSKELLSHELGGVTQYYYERVKQNKDELPTIVEVNLDPPKDVIAQLLALQSERGLLPLKGMITAPTIAYTGCANQYHIVSKAGLDAQTGLYLTTENSDAIPTGKSTPPHKSKPPMMT